MAEIAYSRLCAGLVGEIVKWIDNEQFIACCSGRSIICNKKYWSVKNGN